MTPEKVSTIPSSTEDTKGKATSECEPQRLSQEKVRRTHTHGKIYKQIIKNTQKASRAHTEFNVRYTYS